MIWCGVFLLWFGVVCCGLVCFVVMWCVDVLCVVWFDVVCLCCDVVWYGVV